MNDYGVCAKVGVCGLNARIDASCRGGNWVDPAWSGLGTDDPS